jgi:hypothetical protein
VLQEVLDRSGAEHLFLDSFLHRSAESFRTVALQKVVKSIDVVVPLPGAAVDDLCEVQESRLSQFQQLLTFQIATASWKRFCANTLSGWRLIPSARGTM